MISIVEPVRWGVEHEAFNASFLLTCREAFPGDTLRFHAEAAQLDAVRSLVGDDMVEYRPLTIAGRHDRDLARIVPDYRAARLAVEEAVREQARLLAFTSVTTPLLWPMPRLAARGKLPPTVAVLHGGLSGVLHSPRFNLLKRALSLRAAMLRAPRPMHFLVLERAILDTVRRKAPPLAARLTVLPHPLPPDLLEPPRLERPPAPPVKIGLLGLCTPQKGLNVFLDLARKLADSPARIEFHVVGRIHEQFAERTLAFMRYLSGQPSQAPLPRAEFVRGAAALHYAAFFFDGGHYAATASGVLLDCIALGIPLIGRRHPLLDALTEAAGDIGELCAPGEEEAMLRRLAESFDLQRYEKQRANMLSLRAERTPQALAAALRRLAEPDRSPAA